MKLIVGLGNIGREYGKTRHNVGFMIADAFVENESFSSKAKFKGQFIQMTLHGEPVVVLKPSTYMNLSGESVLAVQQFFNIKPEDTLVIHDDLDLPCGKLRIRQKGSAGGHNGLKSIISCINSENFHRLKVGIDRDPLIPVVDYVLGKFSKEQLHSIAPAIQLSVEVIHDWLMHDITFVMNKYNNKE